MGGYAIISALNSTKRLAISLESVNPSVLSISYDVFATNYDSYALVYGCQQILPMLLKYETLFLLSRTKTMGQEKLDNIKQIFSDSGVEISQLKRPYETFIHYYKFV